MNDKPTLPRKLTLALGGAGMLVSVPPEQTVKIICIAAVVIAGILIQGLLDTETKK